MGERVVGGHTWAEPAAHSGAAEQLLRRGEPAALVDVQYRYDSVRGESVPTAFSRPPQWYQVHPRAYRVLEVVGIWRIPLPWWQHSIDTSVQRSADIGLDSHRIDTVEETSTDAMRPQSSLLLPATRIIWRLMVQRRHSTPPRRPVPAGLCEVACDPNGQWWFLRAYS